MFTKKKLTIAVCAAIAVLATGLLMHGKSESAGGGVRIEELALGQGNGAEVGDTVLVHYTGWLINGKKFDSSLDRGRPLVFRIGAGQVIRGVELGTIGMKAGGRRKITVPAALAYGKKGVGKLIPPNSDLVFELQLLRGPASQ